jgi:hypothetical protein
MVIIIFTIAISRVRCKLASTTRIYDNPSLWKTLTLSVDYIRFHSFYPGFHNIPDLKEQLPGFHKEGVLEYQLIKTTGSQMIAGRPKSQIG